MEGGLTSVAAIRSFFFAFLSGTKSFFRNPAIDHTPKMKVGMHQCSTFKKSIGKSLLFGIFFSYDDALARITLDASWPSRQCPAENASVLAYTTFPLCEKSCLFS